MSIDPDFRIEDAKGMLTIAYSPEELAQHEDLWSQRAQLILGARLGVLKIPDPLGGASYWLFTDSHELAAQVVWPTPEQIRSRCTSLEDANAVQEALRILGEADPAN